MPLHRLSIIGVGLLGGSIGLAVRAVAIPCHIVGYAHRDQTRRRALDTGTIDEAAAGIPQAVVEADLVILCTPVGAFEESLATMAGHLKPGAIITDVGSTKRSIVESAHRLLPPHARFVGSHPMAGSEKRGVEFARADLFHGARCILTPTDNTDRHALAEVDGFWRALGMNTIHLAPQDHDRLVCQISHLPHAVAAALVAMQQPEALQLAGKGFLDATRIASGDGGLWRDILLDNADNLQASLTRLRAELDQLIARLNPNDGESLRQWLDQTARRREELVQLKLRELNPD